ncbi:hypothetical protein DFQ28_004990 [Apophysomyces sp. BC1034]|nr:hypothetical protein DFQ30_004939 [Apophysomyces sp. BC1015]KAG0178057.1 hypothetical protein DFQ29_003998 [Apophysomyces sp. BC1021]KAG0188325.1 hypothetical protein DFQ28_004990 [Apophysomyces sp. BC1034]
MSPYSADGRKLLINRSVGTGGSSTQQQQHLTTGNGRVGRFSGSPHAMEFNSGGGSGLYASARGWLEPELSSSVDRSLRDPFATSAPSQPSSFPVFEEQRRSKQQSQANIFSMDPLISGLRTASPRESDLSSSPYRPFFPHSASTSVLSSSLRGSQALHSIPESSSRYLDVPQGAYYSNGDVFDEDNLEDDEENVNDAMLPSSLNELLTPTELQQRRSREQRQHQHHQQQASYRSYHASYSPGDRMIERSTSESLLGYRQSLMMENQSSFDSLSQQHHQQQQQQQQQQQARSWQVPFYYKSNLYNDLDEGDLDQGKTNAINIPGGGSSGKTQQKASNIQELETTTDPFTQFPNHNHHHHHQTDDEGPFYMEDTEPREDDHKTMEDPHMTPFAFPSLVSLPKSS